MLKKIRQCRTFFSPCNYSSLHYTFTRTSWGVEGCFIILSVSCHILKLGLLKCLPSGSGEEKRACWRFYKDPGWQAIYWKNSTWLLRFKLQQPRGRPSQKKSEVQHKHKTRTVQWVTDSSVSPSHITGTNTATRICHGLAAATSPPGSDAKEAFACQDWYPFYFSGWPPQHWRLQPALETLVLIQRPVQLNDIL